MKKHIAILLSAVLLLTIVFSLGSVALASGFSFKITASPVEMSKGGEVTFSYELFNDTGNDYSGLAVYYNNKVVSNIGQLNDGNPFQDSFKMMVDDSMLGQPLTFHIRESEEGPSIASEEAIVKRKANVDLGATATVNRTLAGTGDTVKLSIELENKGNVDITNINVSATGLNNNKPFNSSAFPLGVGKSHTINYSFAMGTSDLTFTPKITYSADDQNNTKELEPITITLESRNVNVSVSASNSNPQPGEDVTFTLTVSNNGNVSYTNMSVSLNGEDVRFPSSKLKPGDSFTETYTRSYQVSTQVSFSITVKDHTGAVLNVNSNPVNIQLPVDPDRVNLDLSMKADRLQLTSAGVVNFTGSVYNGSEYALTDISVDEVQFGNIFSASTLEPGQRAHIQWSADINETTEYHFVLTAQDGDGNTYTAEADAISVTIAAVEEAEPDYEDAPTMPTADDDVPYSPTKTLLIIAGVLIVLIIGVGVALLVLWKKGRISGARPSKGRPAAGVRKKPSGKRPAPRQKSYRDRNNF